MANEKRLIDANALFAELVEKQYSEQTMGIVASYYPQMRAIVAKQPTVDAVEVVHGRWQERRFICMDSEVMLGYRCSRCTLTFDAESNYCPNCGAKMDGDGNG